MTWLGALLALITEIVRLIDKSGNVTNAVATLKSVNDTFDKVVSATTKTEYQSAAQSISNLESDR